MVVLSASVVVMTGGFGLTFAGGVAGTTGLRGCCGSGGMGFLNCGRRGTGIVLVLVSEKRMLNRTGTALLYRDFMGFMEVLRTCRVSTEFRGGGGFSGNCTGGFSAIIVSAAGR